MQNDMPFKPSQVTEEMDNVSADLLGVISFTYAMNHRMSEMRQKGKGGWNGPRRITTKQFKEDCIKAINENRFVDAGNYAMMLYNLENMNQKNDALKRLS